MTLCSSVLETFKEVIIKFKRLSNDYGFIVHDSLLAYRPIGCMISFVYSSSSLCLSISFSCVYH